MTLSKKMAKKLGIKRNWKPKKKPDYPQSVWEGEMEYLTEGRASANARRVKSGQKPYPSWGKILKDIKENYEKVFELDDSRKQLRWSYNTEYDSSEFFLKSAPVHCGIVIPTEGRPELLRECLIKIQDNSLLSIPVLIVDDGAKKPVKKLDFIKNRKKMFDFPIVVKRPWGKERRGAGAARAFGQDYWHSREKHFVIQMDDDCFIHENCFENLYANAMVNPNHGIIGAIGSFRQFYQGDWRNMFSINAIGVCYVVNKWMIDCCGNFDKRFKARQDVDLAVRAWINGFRVAVLPKADVTHIRYRTKKEPDPKRKEIFEKWRIDAAELLGKKYSKFGLKVSKNGALRYMPEFTKRGYIREEWRK